MYASRAATFPIYICMTAPLSSAASINAESQAAHFPKACWKAVFFRLHRALLIFRSLHIQKSSLKDCTLNESSFADAKLRGTALKNNVFSGCDFGGADIGGCDFSSSSISGARFSLSALKDVKVNYEQAIELAKLLGLKIV